MKDTTTLSLPALGEPLDTGIFAGITTAKDGTHHAVVLLPGNGTKLSWKNAMQWAKDQGGDLPTRPVVAMLFANVKSALPDSGWHWTNEAHDASYAWNCLFTYGIQTTSLKSYEAGAVAVRLIPLEAS